MSKLKCSVKGCLNPVKYKFPRDEKLKQKWLDAILRSNFLPKPSHGICIDHFLPQHIVKVSRDLGNDLVRPRIVKGAIPCIFPWNVNKSNINNVKSRNVMVRKVSSSTVDPLFIKEEVFVKEEFNVDDTQSETGNKDNVNINYLSNSSTKEDIVKSIYEEHHYHCSNVDDSKDSQRIAFCRYSIEQFKDDPKGLFYFTGQDSYKKFMSVLQTLGNKVNDLNYHWDKSAQKEISAENKFFLTLWKLRRNCSDYELSQHFCVSEIAMKVIFKKMIIFMANKWSVLDIWPTCELMNLYMPEGCKTHTFKSEASINKKETVLSNVRVYTEKNIKLFNILSKSLDPTYVPLTSQITGVCIMLCNFKEILQNSIQ